MTWWQAIVMAVVEGATEFLPVSSTGHLILTSWLLGIPQTEFVKTFEIAIQLAAILAVGALYWRRLLQPRLWWTLLVAFLPTALVGFFLYPFIKGVLLGSEWITVSALFFGGMGLLVLERLYVRERHQRHELTTLPARSAFLVGSAQALAVVPGVSRSAATIFGGLFAGLKRAEAAELSFLLALPTMAAATGLDLFKTSFHMTFHEWNLLLLGSVASFLSALVAVRWFVRYVSRHTFFPFAVYRIGVSIVFTLMLLLR